MRCVTDSRAEMVSRCLIVLRPANECVLDRFRTPGCPRGKGFRVVSSAVTDKDGELLQYQVDCSSLTVGRRLQELTRGRPLFEDMASENTDEKCTVDEQ